MCQPGLPKLMGSLHPAGSLYEKPVNTLDSLNQHINFKRVLAENGVRVMDVRDVLMLDTDCDVGARVELEEFASQVLKYEMDKSCDSRLIKKEDLFYVGNNYKRQVLQAMSSDQLVDIIMTNPTVTVTPSLRDTNFTASYSFLPLSNIVFTRDQQITTCNGIVMANLSSQQRKNEVDLMKFSFRKLGLRVIGQITDPGRLEGGDFFPAGKKRLQQIVNSYLLNYPPPPPFFKARICALSASASAPTSRPFSSSWTTTGWELAAWPLSTTSLRRTRTACIWTACSTSSAATAASCSRR